MICCKKCGAWTEDGSLFCPVCGAPFHKTNEIKPEDIDDNKAIALLSYLGLLFLVPLLAKPDSAFCKFHANQGILLLIAELISISVFAVLWTLSCIPFLGLIPLLLAVLIFFATAVLSLVYSIIGIVNTLQGKAKELPLIGKFRILK